ncbi:hypothetical protein GGI59_001208 [Rhizobium lentis]|uniref:Uncharacterized protein n=1 Tax=Rhizobium lentis TaxID=1138194 RepID=A0A7W8XBZ7_9HYPH|nr:hypothetical protein [Rhizobium lentis]MBB5549032.1 hypothetical protein [Rhizobium lentis]MBB5559565.1 hypothetical protein [Rhizobium lentis]MBB5566551.1 hypothetical protein [Rhizobium lentis]
MADIRARHEAFDHLVSNAHVAFVIGNKRASGSYHLRRNAASEVAAVPAPANSFSLSVTIEARLVVPNGALLRVGHTGLRKTDCNLLSVHLGFERSRNAIRLPAMNP